MLALHRRSSSVRRASASNAACSALVSTRNSGPYRCDCATPRLTAASCACTGRVPPGRCAPAPAPDRSARSMRQPSRPPSGAHTSSRIERPTSSHALAPEQARRRRVDLLDGAVARQHDGAHRHRLGDGAQARRVRREQRPVERDRCSVAAMRRSSGRVLVAQHRRRCESRSRRRPATDRRSAPTSCT